MSTFVSQVNGNDIFAARAEATRSGLPFETHGGVTGILPGGMVPGAEDGSGTLATQKYVQDQVGAVAEAMLYKGAVNGTTEVLPTTDYKAGWTYKVAVAGTYAGQTCEVGDLIIANKDYVEGTASNADWDVIQTNIDGAVTGPVSATTGDLAVFDQSTGRIIKDSSIAATNVALKDEMSVVAGTGTDADKTTITLKTGTSATVLTAHQDITGKADKVSGATTGNLAGLDTNGNLTDSGIAASGVKTKQTAKTDPTASGNTLSFIDSITQNENGEITATKKSVEVLSTYATDGTKPVNGTAVAAALATLDAEVTSSDGTNVQVKVTEVDGKVTAVNVTDNTAASDHVHGDITNDGKIGSTANLAVVTGTAGAVTTADLTTAAPTPSGTATSGIAYVASVSQDSKGQISASSSYVPVASTSAYGVVTYTTISLSDISNS